MGQQLWPAAQWGLDSTVSPSPGKSHKAVSTPWGNLEWPLRNPRREGRGSLGLADQGLAAVRQNKDVPYRNLL